MHLLPILTLLREISVDMCSVQYLQQPEEVFAEMHRVLKPGGVAIVSFSNRLFYEKAIAAWRQNTDFGRQQLVKSYFQVVSGYSDPEVVTEVCIQGATHMPSMALFGGVQWWCWRCHGGAALADPCGPSLLQHEVKSPRRYPEPCLLWFR